MDKFFFSIFNFSSIYFGRTLLAALDYNENCHRVQKVDSQGEPMWARRTRKWEPNAAKLVPVLENKTYGM